MITEDSFTRLMHELGDVDAPPSAARLTGIQSKIKRVRVRRTLTAAVAVIAIVAAGVAFATLRGGPEPVPASVPRSWTADDGVVYKLVKYVTMDTAHQTSLAIAIPATSPITIRFTCATSLDPNQPETGSLPGVDIGRGVYPLGPLDKQIDLDCRNGMTPTVADYDPRDLPATDGIARLVVNGEKANVGGGLLKLYPARWTFAIYSWVMPKVLRPVSTLPPMPTVSGNRLVATLPVDWPHQRAVTFHVPAGVTWGIVIGCSDALRGTSPFAVTFMGNTLYGSTYAITINGKGEQNGGTLLACQPVVPAELQGDDVEGPEPLPSTVTITFSLPPIYDDRIDVLQVGVYYATN